MQLMEQRQNRIPINYPIAIEIKMYHWNKRKNDIDNFQKLLLDSMNWIVFVDDSQIQKMTVEKAYNKENPRIEIELFSIDTP